MVSIASTTTTTGTTREMENAVATHCKAMREYQVDIARALHELRYVRDALFDEDTEGFDVETLESEFNGAIAKVESVMEHMRQSIYTLDESEKQSKMASMCCPPHTLPSPSSTIADAIKGLRVSIPVAPPGSSSLPGGTRTAATSSPTWNRSNAGNGAMMMSTSVSTILTKSSASSKVKYPVVPPTPATTPNHTFTVAKTSLDMEPIHLDGTSGLSGTSVTTTSSEHATKRMPVSTPISCGGGTVGMESTSPYFIQAFRDMHDEYLKTAPELQMVGNMLRSYAPSAPVVGRPFSALTPNPLIT